VTTYFLVRWRHDHADEAVLLYEELDDRRMETRKVYEYRDGRLLRTDRVAPGDDVSLAWEPLPSEAEIAAQPVFDVLPLTAEEFDGAWERATDAWA
jgi:hypothetical protein